MSDDVHALSGAYALHALPDDERVTFEQHLEECAACRREVQEFRVVGAELAGLVPDTPPSGLRAAVLAAAGEPDAAETVQWATRELLAARSRQDVVDAVLATVERLGGRVVPAAAADDRAMHLDVGFGSGTPLLPVAEPGSRARQALERHLPQLVEDAHQTLERIHRAQRDAEDRTGPGETDRRSR